MSMRLRRARPLLGGCAGLLLAACATGPKKPPSDAVALPDHGGVRSERLPDGRRSPYAPAREDPSKRGHYTAGGLYAPHIRDTVPDYVPDVDAIPEPEVRHEAPSRYGNRSPYSVLGKAYTVLASAAGFREEGLASYYGNKFHGRRTSNQEVYDMYAFTAAHKSLPLPSFARVTNLDNGRSVIVRVNDRGPFHDGRVIDLSYAAAVKLGYRDTGTARVRVEGLTPGSQAAAPRQALASSARTASGLDGLVTALPPATVLASADRTAPAPAPAPTGQPDPSPPASTTATAPPTDDYRFVLRENGQTRDADAFDAWMRQQNVRIATGKPQTLGASRPSPTASAPDAVAGPGEAASAPASPATAATAPADGAAAVVLQVAAFASQANASQALARLHGAGIGDARLFDGQANGRSVWRLRIGPVAAARAAELERQVAGLGFGVPQRVRE